MYKVVLTRTEHDVHGIEVKYPHIEWIEFPLIKFEYQAIDKDVLEKIQEERGILVFTSQNAVKSFFQQVEGPINQEIACVGPKTANLVKSFGHEVSFIPSKATSYTLAMELDVKENIPITYIGGNLSSETSLKLLKAKTNTFTKVESYKTLSQKHSKEEWQNLLQKKPDLISFCSPSAVTSYKNQIADLGLHVNELTLFAAIGTSTQSAIQEYLDKEAICPERHTFMDMIEAIVNTL